MSDSGFSENYILEEELLQDFDELEKVKLIHQFDSSLEKMLPDQAGVVVGAGSKNWREKGWKTLDLESTPGDFDFHHVAQSMPLTIPRNSLDYIYAEYSLVRGGSKLSELAFASRQVLKDTGLFVIDTNRITDEGTDSGPMMFPFGFNRVSEVEEELRAFGFKCFSVLGDKKLQKDARTQKVRFYCIKDRLRLAFLTK
ncbi:MAG: hypothetical protein M3Q44_04965 [bacterium]|nr:hypothetical protein [bacterium]